MPRFRLVHTRDAATAGCIVTVINTETGEQRVLHEGGYHSQRLLSRHTASEPIRRITTSQTVYESLRRIVAQIDGWEGPWRIRTVSTPSTVYRDLKGRSVGGRGDHDGDRGPSPEAQFLTKIGRPEMWERYA